MAKEMYNIKIADLIYPLFLRSGTGIREEIPSMPGVFRLSPDILLKEVESLTKAGINKLLLFGVGEEKDEYATAAHKDENLISSTVRLLKQHFPASVIMTDVCLCAYTTHGHCGILEREGSIDKQQTLTALKRIAVSHAAAGADYVAPSAMAKEQVRNIRGALDENGFSGTKIMGYSAKFASQFYGPFRDAADSAPRFGDRRSYQLDWADREKALSEIEDDVKEKADIIMVKPALAYLDIIHEAKVRFQRTLAAYNVSGEYAMIKAGAQSGYWDEREAVFEIITAIRRAGADIVITYHAPDIAKWLDREEHSGEEKHRP
ncbi:MAG: porphobilinogen synthase [Candidatus Omnitrophica bacterium]|nr:porphobilinogen synthase [Candidatus Omnitrophota bacterium]